MSLSKREVVFAAASATLLSSSPTRAAKQRVPKDSHTIPSGDRVMAVLQSSPFVEYGTQGPIVYEVGFRACGPCIAFSRKGIGDLVSAGHRVRSFIFAPRPTRSRAGRAGPGQMASIAEVYRTRDPSFLEAWYRSNNIEGFATTRGIADIRNNAVATEAVENGSQKATDLARLLDDELPGLTWGFPAFFWTGRDGHVLGQFGYANSRFLIQAVNRTMRR